jgi:hypothetical protein
MLIMRAGFYPVFLQRAVILADTPDNTAKAVSKLLWPSVKSMKKKE